MNHEAPTFAIMNPLQKSIEEGETIIEQLRFASDHLESCIADERQWQSAYRDALEAYELAETEELADVVIMAQAKEGPLAGIPVSGKGYDIVLTNLKNTLRKGSLANLWEKAERVRRNHLQAQIDLQQAETRFKALRVVAEVKTQVLRASTI